METLNQEEFDKLTMDEQKAYLRQLIVKLPEDKIKELHDELTSAGIFES